MERCSQMRDNPFWPNIHTTAVFWKVLKNAPHMYKWKRILAWPTKLSSDLAQVQFATIMMCLQAHAHFFHQFRISPQSSFANWIQQFFWHSNKSIILKLKATLCPITLVIDPYLSGIGQAHSRLEKFHNSCKYRIQ